MYQLELDASLPSQLSTHYKQSESIFFIETFADKYQNLGPEML